MKVNIFDYDGVIFLGEGLTGVRPNPEDIIVTGRCLEESREVLKHLKERGINNQVFFQNMPVELRTRKDSGTHKVNTLKQLLKSGYEIGVVYEDDPTQLSILKKYLPNLNYIHLNQQLVNL